MNYYWAGELILRWWKFLYFIFIIICISITYIAITDIIFSCIFIFYFHILMSYCIIGVLKLIYKMWRMIITIHLFQLLFTFILSLLQIFFFTSIYWWNYYCGMRGNRKHMRITMHLFLLLFPFPSSLLQISYSLAFFTSIYWWVTVLMGC